MILLTHIAFALISMVFVSYTALYPSKTKLLITYFLTLGTLLSGVIILFTRPVHLGQACASGVAYLGFMIAISIVARKRLAILSQGV